MELDICTPASQVEVNHRLKVGIWRRYNSDINTW